MITYNIKINPLKSRTAYSDIVLTTGDVRGYKFSFLFDGIDFENAIFTLKAKRADGEVVTAVSSLPEIVLPNNMYCVPGEVVFEIAASGETGKYVTAYVLTAFVREGFGDDGISADDRYPVLTTLIDEVNGYKSTFSKLLDENGTLKSEAIANGAITTEKIAEEAVTTGKIAWGAVQSYNIADEAITSEKINGSAVTSYHIAFGAVTRDHLAENLFDGFITRAETQALIEEALQSLPNASGVSF